MVVLAIANVVIYRQKGIIEGSMIDAKKRCDVVSVSSAELTICGTIRSFVRCSMSVPGKCICLLLLLQGERR